MNSPYFNPYVEIAIHTHRLPHWQQGTVLYFVTWRTEDSLPNTLLKEWVELRNAWMAHHPEPWSDETRDEYHLRFGHQLDEWLDAGHGACLLRDEALRAVVTGALFHFDHSRYKLDSFVVMPNHVHVLFRILDEHRLEDILHSWKRWTSRQINIARARRGPFWQEGYWDRMVRNEEHLRALRRYIRRNPIKAGLPANAYTLYFNDDR